MLLVCDRVVLLVLAIELLTDDVGSGVTQGLDEL